MDELCVDVPARQKNTIVVMHLNGSLGEREFL